MTAYNKNQLSLKKENLGLGCSSATEHLLTQLVWGPEVNTNIDGIGVKQVIHNKQHTHETFLGMYIRRKVAQDYKEKRQ